MCLGIPGKIVEKFEVGGLEMGKISFGGLIKEVCLAYVPEAEVGDYAVIHVGFAISRIDEEEALRTYEILMESGMIAEEFGHELMDGAQTKAKTDHQPGG